MLLMVLGGYSLLLCSRYFANNRLMISQLMDEKINRITKFDLAPKKTHLPTKNPRSVIIEHERIFFMFNFLC